MVSTAFPPKYPVGIANSIAREDRYDWTKTIHLAQAMGVRLLQLYLSPQDNLQEELKKLKRNLPANSQLLFHLPQCKQQELAFYLQAIKPYFPSTPLIQHQKYLTSQSVAAVQDAGFILAPENDDLSCDHLFSFRQYVKTLSEKHIHFIPVLDVSRFFHQFQPSFSERNILWEIYEILQLIQEYDLPLLLHLIDHLACAAERADWRPLFAGRLPWEEILREIIRRQLRLFGVVFEYEDPHMAFVSIKKLFGKFPETFTL